MEINDTAMMVAAETYLHMSPPYPHGVKIDCLCDTNGYVYNAMVSSSDPLKYDELRGRVVAVCYALLTSDNLHPHGKNFLHENRIVIPYVSMFQLCDFE